MRNSFILTILVFLFLGNTISAQKIIMKIKDLVPAAGEEVKALEFKIDAESSFIMGAGSSVGKPVPSALLVKKNIGAFTHEIAKKEIQGLFFSEIYFEYYKKNDDKTPYYVITLYEAFVTQCHYLSPECPTCLNLENQIGFVFKKIKFDDKVNNLPLIWNISQMKLE